MTAMLYSAVFPLRSCTRPAAVPVRDIDPVIAATRVERHGHAGHAPVSRRQAPASRRDRVLPHGRLLRDVLRGRPDGVARARADAHVARQGRPRHGHSDVRRAVPRGRRVSGRASSARAIASPSAIRSKIARKAKGLVKREVTRVISPGTFTDAAYLDAREPAFLAAVTPAGPRRPDLGHWPSSTSRPASSPPPSSRAPTATPRWPPNSRCSAPANCSRPTASTSARIVDAFADVPRDARRGLDVRGGARAETAVRSSSTRRRSPASASTRRPAAVSAAAGAVLAYLADDAAHRADARPRHHVARRLRRAPDRSGHAAASERRRRRRGRPARVRCSTRSTARSPPWAAGCSGSGSCGPS